MTVAALITSIASAVATAVLGLAALRYTRQNNLYSAQRQIGDLANTLAQLRSEHPEVMSVATDWTDSSAAVLYGRARSKESAEIVRYYSYVDVGLEFCNASLAARHARHISKQAYEWHYGRLVRLFIAENWPFIAASLGGPYLSQYVKDEVLNAGHDWAAEHRRVANLDRAD